MNLLLLLVFLENGFLVAALGWFITYSIVHCVVLWTFVVRRLASTPQTSACMKNVVFSCI